MPTKIDKQSASGTQRNFTKNYNGSQSSASFLSKQTWDDTRTGEDNPNWRKQIAAGRNATTNYNCSFKKYTPVNGMAVATITKFNGETFIQEINGHSTSYWGIAIPNVLDIDISLADRRAREQFVNKYRAARTKFQSGIFLGELMQTINMIRNPASALRNGLGRYHADVKKRLRRSKNRQRTIRDTWLEYTFGWAPLVNDVRDACQLATADPYAVFEKITAGNEDIQVKTRSKGSFSNGHCKVNYVSEQRGSGTVKYKGAVSAMNQPPGFPEQLGLSWSNVLPTVWELIPYSFLVDYFTNVGKVIEGIATGPITLAWGCRVGVRKGEVEILSASLDQAYLNANTPSGGSNSGFATGAGLVSSVTRLDREPISSVAIGLSDFRFKLPARWQQWFNIAALAKLKS